LLSLLALSGAVTAAPAESNRLLRTPAVSATQIAFACASNIRAVEEQDPLKPPR
jgi:hypothetical protein